MYAFKDPFPYAYIILSHLVLLLEYSAEVSEVSQNVIAFKSFSLQIHAKTKFKTSII